MHILELPLQIQISKQTIEIFGIRDNPLRSPFIS
jgi:hypothetical protein